MFLKFFKNFFIKRTLKNTLSNVKHDFSQGRIKTVGILIDESYFGQTENLIDALVKNGVDRQDISLLIYKDKIKKNETFAHPFFTIKDIHWNGTIGKPEIKAFVAKKFDLLISYYDLEKGALLLVTCSAKANFKVGFASVDKRLNHFMIDTVAEYYQVFTEELFRYLKILNKI